MEETQPANQIARDTLTQWKASLQNNIYLQDKDFIDTIRYYFSDQFENIHHELEIFGEKIATQLEPLVLENHCPSNLPRMETYNEVGSRIDKIIHHPSYVEAGNIIYGSGLLSHLLSPGGLQHCLSLFFLSSEAGEAGHNCPIACSAGIIRVLKKLNDIPNQSFYLQKLTESSYTTNYTGAQFLTEIQGGSDVGQNAAVAVHENNHWRIYGEKWFCSNADADLIFITARFNKSIPGTKGLGLFLVPSMWNDTRNKYTFRRLKDKLGTKTMATAEIDFHGAFAYPIALENGFNIVMENVLHLSRLFNAFCVLGMAKRAYFIAKNYAEYRIAFSKPIIDYPAITENLARIKAENTAMLAGIFATTWIQDQYDQHLISDKKTELLLRLLVNILKYFTAKWSVIHIHHALDILAGNGTIENFSSIPRLLRDCIVCENWEGTHNILHMQVLKDIQKYQIDQIYISYMHSQIETLASNTYRDQLSIELAALKQDFVALEKQNHTIQALQISSLIDRMSALFCALHLLYEANDQLKASQSSSKLFCLEYFWLCHINQKKINYDHSSLELMNNIIKSGSIA